MPGNVLLLIEVSDTTIERHTNPSGDGYRHSEWARRGGNVEPAALPELAFSVEAVVA